MRGARKTEGREQPGRKAETGANRKWGQCGGVGQVMVGGRVAEEHGFPVAPLSLLWGIQLFSGDLNLQSAKVSAGEILWDLHFHKK